MASPKKKQKGLTIRRHFTRAGADPWAAFQYETRTSVIRKPDGEAVFEMRDVEVPSGWSQVATDILAQKYFRKTGVPQADGSMGGEHSVRQVVHRMASCWKHWGEQGGYFATPADAQAFYDEIVYSLLSQMAAPNSPQWFNTGLHHSYGIAGGSQGHYYVDPDSGEVKESTSAYERPQPHACFILSVNDDLVNPGGIMDLFVREARIFKYGSGAGTNYSSIRGAHESLAGGGYSSGLLSFLKIGDRAAGAIKSGGTTRRAAKMVILDMDHPEIREFIRWKADEEKKAGILIANGYPSDYEGEAYQTISGQNSNNTVRIPQSFFEALHLNGDWELKARTNGKTVKKIPARTLWNDIADAAWRCADPGVQFSDTINEWNTCPESGSIRASNPCSEYMFLDDTACNLASVNLGKFWNDEKGEFDTEGFGHACRLWTLVLEISVYMAQFPSREIARNSYDYRTLGLGFANLGSVLMRAGLAYDSVKARSMAGAIASLMTGVAYRTSAEMAESQGAFEGFAKNRDAMLRVIRNHRYAAYNTPEAYEGLSIHPEGLDPRHTPGELLKAACNVWNDALRLGEKHGYRNAQVSVIAPTGTIGLLMDCDTTGIEPDFSLVKFKKLAGGGYFRIINQSVPVALKKLGYSEDQAQAIVEYVVGTGTFVASPHINYETLTARGFSPEELVRLDEAARAAFHIRFLFSWPALGENCMRRLGITPEICMQPGFDLLTHLGFSEFEIEAANDHICGNLTIEGAPYLREEHLPVFDCASPSGAKGKRFLAPMGHLRMMSAVQPFITGAISKTVNLPNAATRDEIATCYEQAWKLGLKACAIYRDGSKFSQPLSSKAPDKKEKEAETETAAETRQEKVTEAELSPEQVLEAARRIMASVGDTSFKRELSRIVERKKLPARRNGFTQKSKIGGHAVFVRTGEYSDGTLGEIFIDMHKEGASFRSLLNCFAISVSIGLQYGVPLEEFVDKFTFTRFDPSGDVDHPYIRRATSILDYVFRLLAWEYLQREDLLHIQPTGEEGERKNPAAQTGTLPGRREKVVMGDTKSAQEMLGNLMGDAPICENCGHITIRSGTCYRCLNCGNSLGCS